MSRLGAVRAHELSRLAMAEPRVETLLGGMHAGAPDGGEPRVARLALALVEFCDRIEPRLLRRRKTGLNEHLQDGAASALANVGEAWDEPNPREKHRFFGYALRSAGECQRQLRGAARVRAVSNADLTEGLRIILALKLDLRRLMDWCRRQPDP